MSTFSYILARGLIYSPHTHTLGVMILYLLVSYIITAYLPLFFSGPCVHPVSYCNHSAKSVSRTGIVYKLGRLKVTHHSTLKCRIYLQVCIIFNDIAILLTGCTFHINCPGLELEPRAFETCWSVNAI